MNISVAAPIASTSCSAILVENNMLLEPVLQQQLSIDTITPMTHGFSLFELLIVMAIIAILAAVSYPSYQQHIAHVQCKQARIALLEIANQLEQEHSLQGHYQQLNISLLIPQHAQNGPYHFYFSQVTQDDYTLNARATQPQRFSAACRLLTLSSHALS